MNIFKRIGEFLWDLDEKTFNGLMIVLFLLFLVVSVLVVSLDYSIRKKEIKNKKMITENHLECCKAID